MANFYYVKSGGTATGDAGRVATTKSTGSFATKGVGAFYPSVYAANNATTPPVAGDYVLCSDIHNNVYGSNTIIGLIDGVIYLSVSDTACETYSQGAIENTSVYYEIRLTSSTADGIFSSRGIHWKCAGHFYLCTARGQYLHIDDGGIYDTAGISGYRMYANYTQYGSYVKISNSVISFSSSGQYFRGINNPRVELDNCTIAGAPTSPFFTDGNGGMTLDIKNSDLTGMASSGTIFTGGTSNNADTVNLNVSRSVVSVGTSFVSSSPLVKSSIVNVESVGIGAGTDNFHYYYKGAPYFGTQQEELGIYRTAGANYNKTGDSFSTKIETTAKTSETIPLKIELVNMVIDTDDYTSTITFKVNLARDGSATPFTNSEVWFEVVHQDGDKRALGAKVSSGIDPFVTSTNLTAESGLWTGLGGTNNEMSITLPAITIGNSATNISTGAIVANMYVAVPSETVYACPQVEVS